MGKLNGFNLWELNSKYYNFENEWNKGIKQYHAKIKEINGDRIVFDIDSESYKKAYYDKYKLGELLEDEMPFFLIKLMEWINIDFDWEWLYGDPDEVDGHQYICFIIW